MNRSFLKSTASLISVISALVYFPAAAKQASNPKWSPRINLDLKAGTSRNIGQVGLFTPLLQNQTSLFFGDFRFMRDSRTNQEGNFGLGFRTLDAVPGHIFGVYGFFDHRYTQYKNALNQITLGTELLSEIWDYRFNTYLPLSSNKNVHGTKGLPKNLTYRGHEALITNTKEVPMMGFDAEVGRSMPGLEDLRLYAGGYHFQGSGVKNMNGARARATYNINKYVQLTGEIQYDNIRKSSKFVGINFTIPFGETSDKTSKLSKLEQRMTDQVIRDVDIVSSRKGTQGTDGKAYVHFTQNAANANADGSFENPYPFTPQTQEEAHRIVASVQNTPYHFRCDGREISRDLALERCAAFLQNQRDREVELARRQNVHLQLQDQFRRREEEARLV